MPRASRNKAYRSRIHLKAKYSRPGTKIMSFGVTKNLYYDIGFRIQQVNNEIQLYEVRDDLRLKNGDELLRINHRTVVGKFEVAKKMILLSYPGNQLRIFIRRRSDDSDNESYNSAESVTISEYQSKKMDEINLANELETKSIPIQQSSDNFDSESNNSAESVTISEYHSKKMDEINLANVLETKSIPASSEEIIPLDSVSLECSATDTDEITEENNLSKHLIMDNPRQLMGQLHVKTVKLQHARQELDQLKSKYNIIDSQLKTMKKGIGQINNKCRFLKQPHLRYKHDPRLY